MYKRVPYVSSFTSQNPWSSGYFLLLWFSGLRRMLCVIWMQHNGGVWTLSCQRTINAEWQLLVPIHLELPETLHYNLSHYGDWNEQFQVSESIMFAIHDNINHSVILVIHSSSTRRYKELYSFVHMRKFTVSSSNCKLLNRRILTW
jgi:hypothetical protein